MFDFVNIVFYKKGYISALLLFILFELLIVITPFSKLAANTLLTTITQTIVLLCHLLK